MSETEPKTQTSLADGLKDKAGALLRTLRRYSLALFILFVAAVYGFVLLRINTLSGTQPSVDAVNSQVKAAQIPRIDPDVVQQLQSLQDNSVSVKSLFNQARDNPFQ